MKNFAIQILISAFLLLSLASCDSHLVYEEGPAPELSVFYRDLNASQIPAIDFEMVRVNKQLNRTLTLRNTGKGVLKIGSINTDHAFFVVGKPSQNELKPGEACDVKISFKPNKWGTYSSNLSIISSDPAKRQTVFTVKGQSTQAPALKLGSITTPEGYNTVKFDFDGKGTKFLTEILTDDPDKAITDGATLHINATFSDGKSHDIIKKGRETEANKLFLSETGDRVSFNTAIRFGMSTFIDFKVYMVLESGEKTPTLEYRFERPADAN
ncbi:MAG: choice-of-anchor D domain-containing protein [Cytophagales bacterium]|nr:MAG: choice-of-anchor D domain-containing protein [Cytophagales bacterium]TAF59339.1 MAG: choice-of-anchor D domain-containing protein [Cytophagales bacterium]